MTVTYKVTVMYYNADVPYRGQSQPNTPAVRSA